MKATVSFVSVRNLSRFTLNLSHSLVHEVCCEVYRRANTRDVITAKIASN